MGEFKANKNEFLVFEKGPSVDVILQWATYRDASDQTSLSRIWGGIHPPADDIPGRLIGDKVGKEAFAFAVPYFSGKTLNLISQAGNEFFIYPNPTVNKELYISNTVESDLFDVYDLVGRKVDISSVEHNRYNNTTLLKFPNHISPGSYLVKINMTTRLIIIKD